MRYLISFYSAKWPTLAHSLVSEENVKQSLEVILQRDSKGVLRRDSLGGTAFSIAFGFPADWDLRDHLSNSKNACDHQCHTSDPALFDCK
jgi:hypothetical protein